MQRHDESFRVRQMPCTLIQEKLLPAEYSLRKELFLFIWKVVYQLFSGRSLRTVTAVCHISLSRN